MEFSLRVRNTTGLLTNEIIYSIALTRLEGVTAQQALLLYREYGNGEAVYDNFRHAAWSVAVRRAEAEVEFMQQKGIRAIPMSDSCYPQRLKDCADAPIVLYYRGNADLNCLHVVAMVGTRKATAYGRDIIRTFVKDLREACPDVLIVSGLAYGVDVASHRAALDNGLDTVGVVAHGLDTLYPSSHRATAAEMVQHGGILTEYMSLTRVDKGNFVRRNRLIAGIADATIVVESAVKGGALITADIAQSYNRDVFAFPGRVNDEYSQGCNALIRDNKAVLITSASDFMLAMRWIDDATLRRAKAEGIETSLFPELTADEAVIVNVLKDTNDLSLNTLSVRASMAIKTLTPVLMSMEMKGIIKFYAGGVYHLIS